ncbi:MAG TPA: DNA methyltransferase [Candidatus Paceibacterota bacterium]
MRVVHEVPLTDVSVADDRQRKEFGDIEGLAISMQKFGLLQPVLLTRGNQLIAGERRYRAAQHNKWETIPALYRDELDPIELEELELEENVQRLDIGWKEKNAAIARIHRLRQERDPNWGQAQTAQLIAEPGKVARQADVSNALLLENAMKLFPEVAEAKSARQALNIVRSKAKGIVRQQDVASRPEYYQSVEDAILLGDSVELIKAIESESIDCIITDPPFGIDYDSRVADTVGSATSYKDGEEQYRHILTMAPDLYRVLRPNTFMVFFLGFSWYEEVKHIFREAGFLVDEIPLVWKRDRGKCFTNYPDKYLPKGYDIALECLKGDPQIAQRRGSNVFDIPPVPNSEREILVERPVELYEELIRTFTIRGQIVADFFVGSGSCPAAAAKLGRKYIGCELDAARRSRAIQKIRSYTPDD